MTEESKKIGRPLKPIDMELVKKLSAIHCTLREIADIIGVDKETIRNRCQDVMIQGKSEGKASLRRRQFEVADTGNPTMLIWLGKNWLGQSDSPDDEEKKNIILPWDDDV